MCWAWRVQAGLEWVTTINRLKFGVTPNTFWPQPISLFTTKLKLPLFIFKTDLAN
jgi:hypothetical protein